MADKPLISGRVTASGATKLKRRLEKYGSLVTTLLYKERIEKLLVRRTKARFTPVGTVTWSQTDPLGRSWARPAAATLQRRKSNKSGAGQALYDTGELFRSIHVVRTQMRRYALASPTGGGFRIGVDPGSPAVAYARLHQEGGTTGTKHNIRVPQRRFLGVGPEDVVAVDRLIKRIARSTGV